MFSCDRCQTNIDFQDAKFTANECLCPSCASDNEVTIGGLPVAMFAELMTIVTDNKESSNDELFVKFLSSEITSPSFAGTAQQLIVLLKNGDFSEVKLDDLQDAIQVSMFFSNLSRYDAEQALRQGKTVYSEPTIELATELVFNF